MQKDQNTENIIEIDSSKEDEEDNVEERVDAVDLFYDEKGIEVSAVYQSHGLAFPSLSSTSIFPSLPLKSLNTSSPSLCSFDEEIEDVTGCQVAQDVQHGSSILEHHVKHLQAHCRRFLAQKYVSRIAKLYCKRTRVAREIWHSETTYLQGLMSMLTIFYQPLLANIQLVSPQSSASLNASASPRLIMTMDDLLSIFDGLMPLIETSKTLVIQLEKMLNNFNPSSMIGPIFVHAADTIQSSFSPYVGHFDQAQSTILRLRHDSQLFQQWLLDTEYKKCDLSLDAYLIMPIQRIMRYALLLRELLNQTWPSHRDHLPLLNAIDAMISVANCLNQQKEERIQRQQTWMILKQIKQCPFHELDPYIEPISSDSTTSSKHEIDLSLSMTKRVYVTEGSVTNLEEEMPVTFHLFLFNDVLIWTRRLSKTRYLFQRLNWLNETTAAPRVMNSLAIFNKDWSIIVHTINREEQNKWLAYLENEDFNPSLTITNSEIIDTILTSSRNGVEKLHNRGHKGSKLVYPLTLNLDQLSQSLVNQSNLSNTSLAFRKCGKTNKSDQETKTWVPNRRTLLQSASDTWKSKFWGSLTKKGGDKKGRTTRKKKQGKEGALTNSLLEALKQTSLLPAEEQGEIAKRMQEGDITKAPALGDIKWINNKRED